MNIKRSTRQCLARHDMKQKDLAEKLNATEGQVSGWINAEHLSTKIIERFAKAFNMSISEFIALGE